MCHFKCAKQGFVTAVNSCSFYFILMFVKVVGVGDKRRHGFPQSDLAGSGLIGFGLHGLGTSFPRLESQVCLNR